MAHKINKYHKILSQWLGEYAQERNSTDEEYQFIVDKEHHHYQVIRSGWENGVFKHVIIFHLQIKETGKVWLYVNRTDIQIDEELALLGLPFSDLVVAFLPPEMRVNTKYAVC